MNFKIFELHLLVNMVEGHHTYYFVGTLWWKAIRPIILLHFMVEGYQTYYFVGTLWWKAIRPIILWVLFHGRLSDLLF
jgi:hypothetical protein